MSNTKLTRKERYKQNFLKTREISIIPVRGPILVVCEDSKSSVIYLREKRDALKLETTKIKITGESGSHPSSVVEYARLEYYKNKAECRKTKQLHYQKVYCVFDVDSHPNLSAAIQRARDLNFIPIVSNEAFELWYLLHYLDGVPGPLTRSELNNRLSIVLGKTYDKSASGMYDLLKTKESNAVTLSKKMLEDAIELTTERNPYRNPSTEVHILIEKLNELATSPSKITK
jgi:hypothetical protein